MKDAFDSTQRGCDGEQMNVPSHFPIAMQSIQTQSRELKLAQEEVSRLSHEVQILADGSGAVRNEHHKLQEELNRRTLKEAEGGGDSGGIGQGEPPPPSLSVASKHIVRDNGMADRRVRLP